MSNTGLFSGTFDCSRLDHADRSIDGGFGNACRFALLPAQSQGTPAEQGIDPVKDFSEAVRPELQGSAIL